MTLLLRSEIFRLVRRWMPRLLLLILTGLICLIYLALWTAIRAGDAEARSLREALRLEAVRDTGASLVFQIGGVMAIILTASLIGSEYGWGTIRTLLPRARSREAFLAAKVVTALSFVAVTVALGFAVAFGASALITMLEDLPSGLGPDGVERTFAAVARTGYVIVPYVALTIMITVGTRSMAAGIGIGLAVFFLEGLIFSLLALAGGWFERLPGAFISRNVEAILRENAEGLSQPFSATTSPMPPVWRSVTVLALYTLVFAGLAFRWFRRRDITAGA